MSGTTTAAARCRRETGAGANRWVVLVVLCVSLLLVALDATVLHVAVPAVTEDLKPGAMELLWIVDVYPLVCASLLILFGTLGDGGHRYVEHGGVDGDQQQADAQNDENDPAVGTGPGLPTASRSGRGRPGHVRTSRGSLAIGGSAGWGLPGAAARRANPGPTQQRRVSRQRTRVPADDTWRTSHVLPAGRVAYATLPGPRHTLRGLPRRASLALPRVTGVPRSWEITGGTEARPGRAARVCGGTPSA